MGRGSRDGANVSLNGVAVLTNHPEHNLIEGDGINITVAAAGTDQSRADITFAVSSGASTTHTHGIPVKDEGAAQGDATSFDFVGSGVTASVAGSVATITVSSGGGSSDLYLAWAGI